MQMYVTLSFCFYRVRSCDYKVTTTEIHSDYRFIVYIQNINARNLSYINQLLNDVFFYSEFHRYEHIMYMDQVN